MGWASAGGIFDAVASELLRVTENEYIVEPVLVALIKQLQDDDWDTEDESLGLFRDSPAVVAAFDRCGVFLERNEEDA